MHGAGLIKAFCATLAMLTLVGGSYHQFGVNDTAILCVPGADMDQSVAAYADESKNLRVGSGYTPGFRFLFPPAEVQLRIPAWAYVEDFGGVPLNGLSGTIGFLGSDDQKRLGPGMRARDTEDEWYSSGSCPNPVTKSIENTNLYEIRCRGDANYSSIWNQLPNSTMTQPDKNDLIVATCDYEKIQIGPFAGKSLSSCRRVTQIEGFLVDYAFQEGNVGLVYELDALIRSKLLEWKKNCSI